MMENESLFFSEKKLYVDVTNLLKVKFLSGIQRVVTEYLGRILETNCFETICVAWDDFRNCFRIVDRDSLMDRVKALSMGIEFNEVRFSGVWDFQKKDEENPVVFFDMDAVWNPGTVKRGYLYGELKKTGVKIAVLIHDVIPVLFPMLAHPYTVYRFYDYLAASLQYADVLLTTTENNRNDLELLLKQGGIGEKPISVIPLGADFHKIQESENEPEIREDAKEAAERGKYLLIVSTVEPRKGHAYLLDCLEEYLLDLDINLVIAGRIGWRSEELEKRIREHELLGDRLFFIESANDDTIAYLYQNAFLFVFPSQYEGYGLPIIEAFSHGVPVLASDIQVFREIGGDFCDYFSLEEPESLAEYVNEYLLNPHRYEERRNLIASYQPPKWDNSAQALLQVLSEIHFSDIQVRDKLEQILLLSAREESISTVLASVEECLPFIKKVLIGCPSWLCDIVSKSYHGKLIIDFLTDEELLEGRELPEDHTPRNFLLRCLAMKSSKLDNTFLMYDDDYRPLVNIRKEDFIQNGKYIGYYFYDLRYWCGTMRDPTSFDRGMYRTLKFLQRNGLPTLQYSAHMPQVIDKRVFLEAIENFPGCEYEGYSEWSFYFNYANARYPRQFMNEPFKTLCWPALSTDWEIMHLPKEYLFENFYPVLYEKLNLRGLPSKWKEETDRTRIQKILRKHVEEFSAMQIRKMNDAMEEYSGYILKDKGAPKSYMLSFEDGKILFTAPKRFFSKIRFCNRPRIALAGFENLDSDEWDLKITYRFEPLRGCNGAVRSATQNIAYGVPCASFPIVAPDLPGAYRLYLWCESTTLKEKPVVVLDTWIYD